MKKALVIAGCLMVLVLPASSLAGKGGGQGDKEEQKLNKEIKKSSKEVAKESKKIFRKTGQAGKSIWRGLKEGFQESK